MGFRVQGSAGSRVKEAFAARVLCVNYMKKGKLESSLGQHPPPALVSHVIADAPIARLIHSTLSVHQITLCEPASEKRKEKKKNKKREKNKRRKKNVKKGEKRRKKETVQFGKDFARTFHGLRLVRFSGVWGSGFSSFLTRALICEHCLRLAGHGSVKKCPLYRVSQHHSAVASGPSSTHQKAWTNKLRVKNPRWALIKWLVRTSFS